MRLVWVIAAHLTYHFEQLGLGGLCNAPFDEVGQRLAVGMFARGQPQCDSATSRGDVRAAVVESLATVQPNDLRPDARAAA
jgi:hypothetical protein